MKRLLLLCCAVIGITTASYAQGGGGRGRMTPEQQLAQMKTSLALTDAQSTKIAAILAAQAKSNDSLRTAANGDREAMMAAMMPLRAKYTAQIKAVLTADQAATYQKELDSRMNRGGGGGGYGGGGGTPPPPNEK
jgi:Spy/CpxP family protein refolding chaperone